MWHLKWPQHIIDSLVTTSNPTGTITNSDLELAGGLIHLDVIAQCFDICEHTVLSKTDNLPTLFWQRKGHARSGDVPATLLRGLFSIHQRHHRYIPRHDDLAGPYNPVTDDASRLFELANTQLLTHIQSITTQKPGYQLWTPPKKLISSVISALCNKPSATESLLDAPAPPVPHGPSGKPSQFTWWASIPFSKPSKTQYQSYKSSHSKFILENLQPKAIQSGLDRLKITYGSLPRRSLVWVP